MSSLVISNFRLSGGNEVAELGPTLFIVIIMFFPLLILGTVGLRYAFFVNAARLAASTGSQCSTFLTDANPPKDCSAVNTANVIATQAASAFSGITLTNISCSIVISPLAGGAVSKQTTPLAAAADTNLNSYNFEVVLNGQLQPLVPNPRNWIFQIPGLTDPIATSARADVVFERTQGLNQ